MYEAFCRQEHYAELNASLALQPDKDFRVRGLKFGWLHLFGVDSDQAHLLPDRHKQSIHVEVHPRAGRYTVGSPRNVVYFFYATHVYLVVHVQALDIPSVAFDDVYQIVYGCIVLEEDVSVVHLVLLQAKETLDCTVKDSAHALHK